MTVRDFYNMVLRDVTNLDGKVTLTVHCPYGGNSLPVEINTISFNNDQSEVFFNLSPVDGVEFEVCDVQEDNDDMHLDFEEKPQTGHLHLPVPTVSEYFDNTPQFGQCGKCGDWVTFPCCNCIARELERGR